MTSRYFPAESRTPLFNASEIPSSGSEIHRRLYVSLYDSSILSVSSWDPPSITMCSRSLNPWARIEFNASVRVAALLREAVITEKNG